MNLASMLTYIVRILFVMSIQKLYNAYFQYSLYMKCSLIFDDLDCNIISRLCIIRFNNLTERTSAENFEDFITTLPHLAYVDDVIKILIITALAFVCLLLRLFFGLVVFLVIFLSLTTQATATNEFTSLIPRYVFSKLTEIFNRGALSLGLQARTGFFSSIEASSGVSEIRADSQI